jgi:hypothetical protein
MHCHLVAPVVDGAAVTTMFLLHRVLSHLVPWHLYDHEFDYISLATVPL